MELLVSILALGSTYALLAAGIVIIYKASRVINFAHGELAIVGAYVFHSAGFLTGTTLTALSLFTAIVVAATASALFGVVIYFALMRRLLGRPTFVAAMVTIGLAIILKAAIVVIWNSRSVGIPIGRQALYNFAGGGRITWIDVISVLTCAAAFAALLSSFNSRVSADSSAALQKIRCSPHNARSTSILFSRLHGAWRYSPRHWPAFCSARAQC